MDDSHVTTLRPRAKVRLEPCGNPRGFMAGPAEVSWAPKQLHDFLDEADLLDEVAETRPTLKQRMENWGSD
jgi:hypothetical protein